MVDFYFLYFMSSVRLSVCLHSNHFYLKSCFHLLISHHENVGECDIISKNHNLFPTCITTSHLPLGASITCLSSMHSTHEVFVVSGLIVPCSWCTMHIFLLLYLSRHFLYLNLRSDY